MTKTAILLTLLMTGCTNAHPIITITAPDGKQTQVDSAWMGKIGEAVCVVDRIWNLVTVKCLDPQNKPEVVLEVDCSDYVQISGRAKLPGGTIKVDCNPS